MFVPMMTKAILSEQGEVSKPHSSGIKKAVVEDSWKDRDHVLELKGTKASFWQKKLNPVKLL